MCASDLHVRRCSVCGGSGPFGADKHAKDGLKSHCKKCCAEKQADYRKAHPEVWSNWASENADRLKKKDSDRYWSDPEKDKARVKKWQSNNPSKVKTNSIHYNLSKYHLTPEERDSIFEKQGGKCAICLDLLKTSRVGMQVDHDHATGSVRGLLCVHCNTMIGDFREILTRFESAVAYLRRGRITDLPPSPRIPGISRQPSRVRNLLYRYGLTEQNIQEILNRQNGCCGVCKDPLAMGPNMHIDHDHSLGRKNGLRGLLCRSCNLGLGHARENERILMSAIEYLRRHRASLVV